MSLTISGLSNAESPSSVDNGMEVNKDAEARVLSNVDNSTQTDGADWISVPPGRRRDFDMLKRAAEDLGMVDEVVTKRPNNYKGGSKTSDLFEYLLKARITNRTLFEQRPSSEILSYLMMPNIESVLPRGFNFVAMQLRKEPFEPVSIDERPVIHLALKVRVSKLRLFLCGVQGWSVKQYKCFFLLLMKVMNGDTSKKNCMWIWGPSNTGKSTVAAAFIDYFFPTCVGKPDNNDRTSFPFNACVNKRVIFWEEPTIHPQNVEDVKCLMSGTTFSTDIKYQSAVEIHKTPVLVTCNKVPWQGMSESNVMRSRCFTFKFGTVLDDAWLRDNAAKYFPFSKEDFMMSFEECTNESVMLGDDVAFESVIV
uniref:Nonstructural protein 1 n=1 Tax=Turdus pallidus parvoviridae sp. TaxID=2794526 RepID=A0A8A4XCT6_9VIRU|nr:MAG: nonstructural protein 1 [Turdus pallidus parvoviridae sp.]